MKTIVCAADVYARPTDYCAGTQSAVRDWFQQPSLTTDAPLSLDNKSRPAFSHKNSLPFLVHIMLKLHVPSFK